MVKNLKKIVSLTFAFIIVSLIIIACMQVRAKDVSGEVSLLHELDSTSNFFTKVEDTRQVETVADEEALQNELLGKGYVKAAYNSSLTVYFKDETFAIAVYDKASHYVWYSEYQNIDNYNFNEDSIHVVQSGIILDYYLANSTGDFVASTIYYSSKEKGSSIGQSRMKQFANGFDLDVSFANYGISFKVEIRLDNNKLKVSVPSSSIKEVTIGKLTKKDYKLRSIILFPYFGSDNYLINGYSFIPDGSGALIRFDEHPSSTSYVKKLYGEDYSFTDYSSIEHIKENGVLGLPIYGINHGYNQAAFLCELEEGFGSAELCSYPYMSSSIPLNRTYFRYYARDTFDVKLSSGTMNLLNEKPYPSDFTMSYTFLANDDASYVGMANAYRESLGLNENNYTASDIPLRLEVLGMDYKPGLFGKNYVKMTSFEETLGIIKDLEQSNVNNFNITYLGWNRGGYFNNGAVNAKAASILGGKNKLKKLNNYVSDQGYNIDFTINPYVTSSYGTGNKGVKKIGLTPFEVTQKSSMEQVGYYVLPTELASIITKKNKRYEKNDIDALKIDNLNVAYSYRYKSDAVYRSQMIEEVVNEMSKIEGYEISTEKPNAYLLKYLTNYYDAYYESNKFIYETDSVPFMSILLSGYVNQFMPNINYISDYDLAILRMIEYNIYPSFIITKEEAYDLRYTNYEYLNSTQYDLWKELIVRMYEKTNDALRYVIGAKLVNHSYVASGVAKCSYSNGVTIYINYNNASKLVDGISLAPYSYYVKGGN